MNLKEKIDVQKIKGKINEIFNSKWFVIIIGILIFLKTIFFYQNTIMIREKLNFNTVMGTITFIAIMMLICLIFPNKQRIFTILTFNIVISILLFSDNLYYLYSSNVLSVEQISNLQYGEEIMSTLPMLLSIKHVVYFIDIILIFILLGTKNLKIKDNIKLNKRGKALRIFAGSLAIFIYVAFGNTYSSKSFEDPYNKDLQIKKSSIYGYHIADIQNAFQIKKQAVYNNKNDMEKDYNDLKNNYNTKYSASNYELQGAIKGKNIIILQLESIQEFVLHKTINGKEITPNLNRFLEENIEFSNMFMQSYSSTADSEFSTISSLYPMENGMSYSKYNSNKIDDIFTMFHQGDYTISYMHGNYGFFWNRVNVYSNLPVDHLEFKDSFEDVSENIMGYLSDELLYNQAVEKLTNYEKPFMSYIVSASSHTNFSLDGLEDRSKVQIDVGKYKGTFFGNYLESVNYADYAFGIFIDNLKEAGLYDDTVILLYGDHNGIDMYNEEMLDYLQKENPNLNDVDIKLNYIRVACGMKIPGIEHLKIEKQVSKLDIKPTFAYLCNLNEGFALGTNMFARKDFACLNNERIITSRYYFDENWYEIESGNLVDLESLPKDEEELLLEYQFDMKTELDISKSIQIYNLLK